LNLDRAYSAQANKVPVFQSSLIGDRFIVYSSPVAASQIREPELAVTIFDHGMIFRDLAVTLDADGIVRAPSNGNGPMLDLYAASPLTWLAYNECCC
jgi:hypothetical protein